METNLELFRDITTCILTEISCYNLSTEYREQLIELIEAVAEVEHAMVCFSELK